MNIDFWQAIKGTQARLNITRYEICGTCHGSGSTGAGEVTCPQCKGTGNVSQMAGAMKFNLTCPRCGGTGKLRNACPTCGGDGRVTHTETVEVRIPPGARNGSRLRVPGKGNAGTMGAPPGDLYITTKVEDASVLPPRRRQYRDQGAGRGLGGGAGRQDRSADHRRPHAAEDPAGHHRTGSGSGCARRACSTRAPISAATRSWRSRSRRPTRATSAPANCCASWRKLHPEDPRAEMWAKV